MLLGLPYKAQFETGPLGTGAHVFDENGAVSNTQKSAVVDTVIQQNKSLDVKV